MKIIIKILFLQSLVFLCGNCHSQQIPLVDTIGDHFHWTLADKVKKSDAVIEGRVINQFSQWTEGFLGPKGNVFTSVIIRVSRIFKGQVNDTIIEVIINGGVYPSGSRKGQRSRSDYGWIFPGYEGLFFLRSNNTDIQSGKNLQSFFYLRFESTAIGYTANPLNSPYPEAYYEGKMISDFENILYQPIEAITGTPAKVIGLNSYEAAAKKQQR